MASLLGILPSYELTLFHRILLIWAWMGCGLLVSFQLAQQTAAQPYAWTRLTDRTRYAWF
jgi:hypothetical protein